MFIQTEETPNPETLKFIPRCMVLAKGTVNFPDANTAWRSVLTERLFQFAEVQSILLGEDFIAITKNHAYEWQTIRPQLLTVIMEYFLEYEKVEVQQDNDKGDSRTESPIETEDKEIIKEIKELLETRIASAVARDGGSIVFDSFIEGVVYLKLQGACSSCPSSTLTLKSGIERMLRHYIPEVEEVRAI